MVRRFVPGDSLDDALAALDDAAGAGHALDGRRARRIGRLDATRPPPSADRYIATLDALAERGLEANVSLKLTAMGLDIDPDFCLQNVRRVVARAREIGAFVRVDMEDHTKTDKTLDIARALHDDHPEVGVVIQSYLRRSADDIDQLIREQIRVRLCKGAYDEPAAVAFKSKEEVDDSYRVLMETLAARGPLPGAGDARRGAHRARHRVRSRARHQRPTASSSRCSTACAATCSSAWSSWAGRCASTFPTAPSGIPYYMRRLAERPQNVLFMFFSVLKEGRGKKT